MDHAENKPKATDEDGVCGLVELTKSVGLTDVGAEYAIIEGGYAYVFPSRAEAEEAQKKATAFLIRCPAFSVTCRTIDDMIAHVDKTHTATLGNLIRGALIQIHDLELRVSKTEEAIKCLTTITAPMGPHEPSMRMSTPPNPCVYWPQPPHGLSTFLPPPAFMPQYGYPQQLQQLQQFQQFQQPQCPQQFQYPLQLPPLPPLPSPLQQMPQAKPSPPQSKPSPTPQEQMMKASSSSVKKAAKYLG